MYDRLKEEDRKFIELDFGDTQDVLRREYLDIYDWVRSKVRHTTKFDEIQI